MNVGRPVWIDGPQGRGRLANELAEPQRDHQLAIVMQVVAVYAFFSFVGPCTTLSSPLQGTLVFGVHLGDLLRLAGDGAQIRD